MMTLMKLLALGLLLGTTGYAALRARRGRQARMPEDRTAGAFEPGDLDEPVTVTEEVVVVTEAMPIDAELVDEQGELITPR